MSEDTKLLELGVHFGIVGYGTVRDLLKIIDYAKKFTNAKIFYEEKSIVPLFIVRKKPRESAGENQT